MDFAFTFIQNFEGSRVVVLVQCILALWQLEDR